MKKLILFLFLSLVISHLSFAEVRYVSHSGTNTPPYLTWETAADSIMSAINISSFGDTIYVANGVYEEQVEMVPGLSLIGAGLDSCVIDTHNLVTMQNFVSVKIADNCQLKGFHIIVYNSWDKGIGISVNGSASNCLVTLNRVSNGYEGIYLGNNPMIYKNNFDNLSIGIDLFNSNAIVRKNNISINKNSGLSIIAGIYVEAFDLSYKPLIDSNYIYVVNGATGIRKDYGARPEIINNVIFVVQYSKGISIGYTDSTKVINNLIIGEGGGGGITDGFEQYICNNAAINLIGAAGYEISGTVKNNLVINSGSGIVKYGNPTIQYNDSWNNVHNFSGFTPDSTNLSVDPMGLNTDTTQGDLNFHLQMFSPLIDRGDPTILDKDSSRSDIGLYGGPYGESYKYFDLPPRRPVNFSAVLDTNEILLRWNKNTETDLNHYNLYRDTTENFTTDSTTLVVSLTDTFYHHIIPPGIQNLYFKITAVDNQRNESGPSEELHVFITEIINNEKLTISNYQLYQNYPNPFNPSTKIGYRLKDRGYVKLYVYDIKGELIQILVNKFQEGGYYEVEFNAARNQQPATRNLSSGIYIYQIMVRNEKDIPIFSDIKKMILIK